MYLAIAATALSGVTFAIGKLRPAAPLVDRSSVWIDTVVGGPLVVEVAGQGTLVPEEIRWIAAKGKARVERVLVRPGATVSADTVLLELSDSDLELQALEADRQLAQAQAEIVNLQASLNSQRLSQESAIATLNSEVADARRRARADEQLASKGFLSELEKSQTQGRAAELEGRVEFETKRLAAQSQGTAAQVAAQRAQVERLRAIADFRRKELDELRVRAGVDGTLQELSLQPGEPVTAGRILAKVARPDRLKAEVRIPETQAADVQVGQSATIDTHNGLIPGRVARIDPAVQSGRVLVDITLEGPLPAGTRPDLNIQGRIEIERLENSLYVGRPASGRPGTTIGLFKLDADGSGAERKSVRLGHSSVNSIQILAGLEKGDQVILSDVSQWDRVDRIRLQ